MGFPALVSDPFNGSGQVPAINIRGSSRVINIQLQNIQENEDQESCSKLYQELK